MSPTAQQAAEANRLIAQKLAADRPRLRLVEKERETWIPDCSECNDAVVVRSGPYCECAAGEESKRLWAAMKASDAAARHRRLERVREKLVKAGGFIVPARYKGYTPRSLQALIGKREWDKNSNASLRAAVDIAIAWADGKLERPGLLLTGDTGIGKTALMLWASKRRAERTGESKLLIRYGRFINAVQGTYSGNGDLSKEQLLLAASTVDLLLLDDFGENALGLKAASNDKQNIIREVMDHRNMNDLATVIITNLTQSQLQAQFGPDIVGRLREHCLLVEVSGTDLREKGAVGWSK